MSNKRGKEMKNSVLFSVRFHHPKGKSQFFTVYSDGTMICSGDRKYCLKSSTVSHLRSKVNKASRIMAFFTTSVEGYPNEIITEIQCNRHVVKVYPSLKKIDDYYPNLYFKFIYRLKMDIYEILEKEEPMFISAINGVYMLDDRYDISLQIKQLCQSLKTVDDKELQYSLFVFLLTALYWSNQTVFYLVSHGEPIAIKSNFYFNLEEDIVNKTNFAALPFRELLHLLMNRHGEVKLGYQPMPQYMWSTDVIRDCFFDCKTL